MADQPKCILIGLEAQESYTPTPAMTLATELARLHAACLTVCVLAPGLYVPVTRTGGSASQLLKEELRRIEHQAIQTAREAGKSAGSAGVECMTEHSMSPLEARSARLVRLARVNDVTVVDAPPQDDSEHRKVIEDVLFDSGRSVLIVPPSGGRAAPQRIAIAWDGSARSARAVDDALGLLREAEKVFIVTVAGEKDLSRMAPGADLATYLMRHDVPEPRIETLTAEDGDVAERLRAFVRDRSIDMLVMGAFVHSRFREAILGGVTRSMLEDAPVPLFTAH